MRRTSNFIQGLKSSKQAIFKVITQQKIIKYTHTSTLDVVHIPKCHIHSIGWPVNSKNLISPHQDHINGSYSRQIEHCWKAENISFLTMYNISGAVGLVECWLWQKWESHFHTALFCSSTDVLCRIMLTEEIHPSNTCKNLLKVSSKETKKHVLLQFFLHSSPHFMFFTLMIFVFYA